MQHVVFSPAASSFPAGKKCERKEWVHIDFFIALQKIYYDDT
jgi:hypothetical protein